MLLPINDHSAGHDPEATILLNLDAIDYIERGKTLSTITLRNGRQFEVTHTQADDVINQMGEPQG
jgi:uncharacterized protein YlzI (FlbEa/FlbD family)